MYWITNLTKFLKFYLENHYHGVRGWGSPSYCRNYERYKDWKSKAVHYDNSGRLKLILLCKFCNIILLSCDPPSKKINRDKLFLNVDILNEKIY